ncbi:MAG TPA: rod shape-determining protein MreC [Actinomycetota bacterium]|nr:rod shape-determining protein MreC [Actinomycetota bacterium]
MATYAKHRSTRLLVVSLMLASLVTITVDSRGGRAGPLAALGRAGAAIIGPMQEGVSAVFRPVGSFFSNVFRAGALAQENTALREQIGLLQRQIQENLTLRRELEELRRLLDIAEIHDIEGVGATVIGEDTSNFEWAVTIDKGSEDGVVVDMPVLAGEGLVGRVVEVSSGQSKVLLIIDPDSAVAAKLSASGERGVLGGQREELLQFELVDPATEVRPGELVETSGYQLESGQEGVYPPGIPIGEVAQVEPDEAELTLRVLVRPHVDFSRLSTVIIVTGTTSLIPEATPPPPGG